MRVMRDREERCAVIFIRSCCAIMIAAHHCSHPERASKRAASPAVNSNKKLNLRNIG